MAKLLEKLPPKEIENMNDLITIKDFESTIKTYPSKKLKAISLTGKI